MLLRKNGSTSNILDWRMRRSDTGQGLTGLSGSSTGLIIATQCDNEAAATVYSQAAGTIQTITTLGTFAAPSASNCRFKEIDSTNEKGEYQFQFDNARFAVAGAKFLEVSWTGATNLLDGGVHDPTDFDRRG